MSAKNLVDIKIRQIIQRFSDLVTDKHRPRRCYHLPAFATRSLEGTFVLRRLVFEYSFLLDDVFCLLWLSTGGRVQKYNAMVLALDYLKVINIPY